MPGRPTDILKSLLSLLKNGYIYGTLAVVYLVFVTFPGFYIPIGVGLDKSWQYAINYLPHSTYLYGRDVVFTYGPLGFLLIPHNIGNNLAFSMAFQVLMQVLFASALFYFLYRARHKLQVVLFVILYLVIGITVSWLTGEYTFLLTLGMLLCISFDSNRVIKYSSAGISGALAGLLLFTKFNTGVSAVAMLVVWGIIVAVSRREKGWKLLLAGGGTYILAVTVIAFAFMQSPAAIVQWLSYSLEIAGAYGGAMSLEGSNVSLLLGALSLAVYAALVVILWRQKAKSLNAALIFALPAFLVFKHAFCRQDIWHELSFFMLPAIVCVLLLSSAGKKDLITCLVGFFITYSLAVAIIHPDVSRMPVNRLPANQLPVNQLIVKTLDLTGRQSSWTTIKSELRDSVNMQIDSNKDFLKGKTGWANISCMFNFGELRRRMDEQGRANLAADQLPADMVGIIKSGGGAAGVIPWEVCYLPANGLEWKPMFTLQSYDIFTPSLDLKDSANYAGENATAFLIVDFANIDYRNIILDAPASWYEIISNYEVAYQDSAGHLLLKKKPQDGVDKRLAAGSTSAAANSWVDIPQSDHLMFARVDMQLNWLGRLAMAFFRVPPVYIDLLYESGTPVTYRITPDTARNGLLINFLPYRGEDLAGIFKGIARDRAVKFRINGSGTASYGDNITVNWEESDRPLEFSPVNLSDMVYTGQFSSFHIDNIYSDLFGGMQEGMQDTYVFEGLSPGSSIGIYGWAIDQTAKKAAGAMFITLDDKYDIPAVYGADRKDVADYFKEDNYRYCGYSGAIPASVLDRGSHTLSFKLVSNDNKSYYVSDRKVNIIIK